MYARLALIMLGPGKGEDASRIAAQLSQTLKSQNGFKQVMFFADEDAGEYGSLSLWETKEDAQAASAALRPMVGELVRDVTSMEGESRVRHFRIVEPGS